MRGGARTYPLDSADIAQPGQRPINRCAGHAQPYFNVGAIGLAHSDDGFKHIPAHGLALVAHAVRAPCPINRMRWPAAGNAGIGA